MDARNPNARSITFPSDRKIVENGTMQALDRLAEFVRTMHVSELNAS